MPLEFKLLFWSGKLLSYFAKEEKGLQEYE